MERVQGRDVHFELDDHSREIFESIIISRYSVRDECDEVLRTDDGLTFIPRGLSNWTLSVDRSEVLTPASDGVAVRLKDGEVPDLVRVHARWLRPGEILEFGIEIREGGNANVFQQFGTVLVPDSFRIPVVEASVTNVGYYGLSLIENHSGLVLESNEHDLILARYQYASNYLADFLTHEQGGGGFFVETHNFPHLHVPLSRDCGGCILIGKRLSVDVFEFTGFRIPYGFALITPANTIHGDGTIVGSYAITVAITTAKAETVLFYNERTRSMARDVI